MRKSPYIYLDYNATVPLTKEVRDAVLESLDFMGNPSSIHQAGKKARNFLTKTRDVLSSFLNVSPQTLIFTSGGTESNALALHGVDVDVVLTSSIEHSSVYNTAKSLENNHILFNEIPVDDQGIIDLKILKHMLASHKEKKILISVMLANNESGVIEPISEIQECAQAYSALIHVDAVQAFGKIPFSHDLFKADLISFSAHKIGGPMGIGSLYIREGLTLRPLYGGGGQERRLRSGTENVPGLAGFAKAIENIDMSKWDVIKSRRDFLEATLKEKFPDLFIASSRALRLPNTSLIGRPSLPNNIQVIKLDLEGICVSAGSSCSSGVLKESFVLKAMGVDENYRKSAIRISLGTSTTQEEIERFISAYTDLQERH